jgi:hypothetical protein
MSFVPRGRIFNIVRQHQLPIDEETLGRIAELLGIPGRIISGTIYVSDPPTPPGASAAISAPGETTSPTSPGETTSPTSPGETTSPTSPGERR